MFLLKPVVDVNGESDTKQKQDSADGIIKLNLEVQVATRRML